MANFEEEKFRFPDEQSASPEIEIDIEDDTPEEDRGRAPMPKEIVRKLDNDDDELEQYDETVKQKLKQLKKVWHDERREKETAFREHQEAVALAKRLLEENQKLKGAYQTGEKEYITTVQEAAHYELESAKRSYREAYESGDTDGIISAQEKLNLAQMKLMRAANLKETPLQEDEYVVQQLQQHLQPRAAAPQPDERAVAWQRKNAWFGQDQEMTAAALGLHEKLRTQGVTVGSDEYYDALDKTMRRRFGEYFDDSDSKPQSKGKPTTVVAPATRSTSSNRVTLKQSQLQLAKKLGLTPEQYAKEMIRLENRI